MPHSNRVLFINTSVPVWHILYEYSVAGKYSPKFLFTDVRLVLTQQGLNLSTWYTLFAHALNCHRIPWRLCSYVYTCIKTTAYNIEGSRGVVRSGCGQGNGCSQVGIN